MTSKHRPRNIIALPTAILIILFSLAQTISSTPIAQNNTNGLTWELEGDPPGKLTCVSDRSSDYYGLGVRLGIYMSWLTCYISNISVSSEIAGSLDQNAIFLLALVIAMVRCATTNLLSEMDGLMLIHLMSGTVFSVLTIWGYRTCVYRDEGPRGIRNFGGFGTHLRLLLCMAVSVLGLWFWYFGVVGALLRPTQCILLLGYLGCKLLLIGFGRGEMSTLMMLRREVRVMMSNLSMRKIKARQGGESDGAAERTQQSIAVTVKQQKREPNANLIFKYARNLEPPISKSYLSFKDN